jgi:hypothetical protein
MLEQLGRHCTSLHTLMVRVGDSSSSGAAARGAALCAPKQRVTTALQVRSCRRITDAGIASFLRGCSALTDANLSGTGVTTAGVRVLAERCPGLRRLALDATPVLALPLRLADLPDLEQLVLPDALVVPPPAVRAAGLHAVRAYLRCLGEPGALGEVRACVRAAAACTYGSAG